MGPPAGWRDEEVEDEGAEVAMSEVVISAGAAAGWEVEPSCEEELCLGGSKAKERPEGSTNADRAKALRVENTGGAKGLKTLVAWKGPPAIVVLSLSTGGGGMDTSIFSSATTL